MHRWVFFEILKAGDPQRPFRLYPTDSFLIDLYLIGMAIHTDMHNLKWSVHFLKGLGNDVYSNESKDEYTISAFLRLKW
ncbi:hypothetical protein J25TS5_54850 [Paenibacillus faecis]|nr:hypothetical protein J25TS5_54850 [Paenibacillus faecis]